MATSPTQLTLARLRRDGWLAEVTERWNPHAMIRQDLWGFVDVLALRDGETLAVQATSDRNVSSRVHKIADSDNIGALRKAGWRVEVWGWRQRKPRTAWILRVVDVS